MPTTTSNYGLTKPDVSGSDGAWGPMLNGNFDIIDTTMKTNANVAATSIGDNRIINGNFAVNQRVNTSGTALAAAAYGHDRWKAGASGCTYTFTTAVPDTTITITAGTLTQVIETAFIEGGVYVLSWTGTAQGRVYQGAPTGSYATSPIVTSSLTGGTSVIVEFNTGTVGRVKFEIGSIVTPFNRFSPAKVNIDCQRYFQSTPISVCGYNTTGLTIYNTFFLPVMMRANPTVVFSGLGYTNSSALATAAANTTTWTASLIVTATGSGVVSGNATFNAEL